jgi:hypothetical protein
MLPKTIFEEFSDSLEDNPMLGVDSDFVLGPPPNLGIYERELVEVAPVSPAPYTSASLDDERIRIRTALDAYGAITDPDHVLLVTAQAGFGKTFAGVDFIHDVLAASTNRVIYFGTRHAFYSDMLATAIQQGNDVREWLEWLPRQGASLNKKETCRYPDEIGHWQTKGFKSMDFCLGVCGPTYVNNDCPYHLQKKLPQRVIFGQHAHLTLGHPLSDQFGIAIGDENPMTSFFREWTIPVNGMVWGTLNMKYELGKILWELKERAKTVRFLRGPELIDWVGGPDRVIDACDAYPAINTANLLVKPKSINEADQAPYNFLFDFVPLLRREAKCCKEGKQYLNRIIVTPRGLTLVLRNYVSPEMPKHMIWFDGTGRQDIYEVLFRRPVKVVTSNLPMVGEVIQMVDRSNCKTSMVVKDKASKQSHLTSKTVQAEQIIDRIKELHGGCAVVTYKELVSQGRFPDALWFYANRGTNQLSTCKALAVVGTPQTPRHQITLLASSLLFERDEAFDATWVTELETYRYTDAEGKSWAKPISTFADPILRIFLWQLREAEIIQSAHRARILTRDVPVYLLTNIPIAELPPTKLMTITELMGAPPQVDVFNWAATVALIEQIYEEKSVVTVTDLMDRMDIKRSTALRYFDMLSRQDNGWEVGLHRAGQKGGRPAYGITKT